MKKVVLASLLACAAISSGLPSASAQQPVALGSQPAGGGQVQMSDAEYAAYTSAIGQTTPQAKASAIEAYLTAFPQSSVKLPTLVTLMATYAGFDPAKTLDAADRVLQLDPNNLRALVFEAYLRKQSADAIADPAGKQAALDAAATAAQKGLAAPKPADVSDTDFKTLQATAFPIFYSAIGTAALNKKDTPTAIDAFKKELGSVPVAQTQAVGPQLQDTYFLGIAYYQSTPPDWLNCAFYVARFVAFAPDALKTQFGPTAKYCYRNFHGAYDGYDAIASAAQANLAPPPTLFASIKPAKTPADIVTETIASTPDLATLAVGDKEYILQNGTPEQAAKVWDTVKGKSVEIPGAIVIASSPTQIQVAISDDAVQSKTADFTFNMKAPEPIPDLPRTATLAQKAAYKKKQEAAAAVTAASAVGQTVTLTGTYDSYTPKPLMITMSDGEIVLPKAATKPAGPVHRAPAHK